MTSSARASARPSVVWEELRSRRGSAPGPAWRRSGRVWPAPGLDALARGEEGDASDEGDPARDPEEGVAGLRPRHDQGDADRDQGKAERDRDADVEAGAEGDAPAPAGRLLRRPHLGAA